MITLTVFSISWSSFALCVWQNMHSMNAFLSRSSRYRKERRTPPRATNRVTRIMVQ